MVTCFLEHSVVIESLSLTRETLDRPWPWRDDLHVRQAVKSPFCRNFRQNLARSFWKNFCNFLPQFSEGELYCLATRQQQTCSSCRSDNVQKVEDLLLSHENEPKMHQSTEISCETSIPYSSMCRIIHCHLLAACPQNPFLVLLLSKIWLHTAILCTLFPVRDKFCSCTTSKVILAYWIIVSTEFRGFVVNLG